MHPLLVRVSYVSNPTSLRYPDSLTAMIVVTMKARAIKATSVLIIFIKLACFPVQNRPIKITIKNTAIIGLFRNEIEVSTANHSVVTSATTLITPMQEDTIETKSPNIIKIATGLPNAFRKLYIKVSPVTMVSLLIAISRK